MLFLPCTPEEKYSAKQAIDSFFFRAGDVLSAATVFVGSAIVPLGTTGFAAVNVVLAVCLGGAGVADRAAPTAGSPRRSPQ